MYGWESAAFVAGGELSPEMGIGRGFGSWDAAPAFGSLWHTVPRALSWLDAHGDASRWLLFVHGYDAHARYLKPTPFGYSHADRSYGGLAQAAVRGVGPDRVATQRFIDGWFHPDIGAMSNIAAEEARPRSAEGRARLLQDANRRGGLARATDGDTALIRGVYDGAVSYLDTQFGLFMAGLQDRGLLSRATLDPRGRSRPGPVTHGHQSRRAGGEGRVRCAGLQRSGVRSRGCGRRLRPLPHGARCPDREPGPPHACACRRAGLVQQPQHPRLGSGLTNGRRCRRRCCHRAGPERRMVYLHGPSGGGARPRSGGEGPHQRRDRPGRGEGGGSRGQTGARCFVHWRPPHVAWGSGSPLRSRGGDGRGLPTARSSAPGSRVTDDIGRSTAT